MGEACGLILRGFDWANPEVPETPLVPGSVQNASAGVSKACASLRVPTQRLTALQLQASSS